MYFGTMDREPAQIVQFVSRSDLTETSDEMLENEHDCSKQKISELYDELREKDEQLQRFQTAYQHFADLHCELEARCNATDAVMVKASQWYHENKMLKRKSTILLNTLRDKSDVWLNEEPDLKLEEVDIDAMLIDVKDKLSRTTFKQLQAEQQNEILREKLNLVEKAFEEESISHEITKKNLSHQQDLLNHLQRVSMIAVDEFQQIQVQLDEERSTAAKAKECIEEVKRERNVLARQSAILLAAVGTDKKLMEAAMELERLTMIVERQSKELEELTKSTDEWKNKWEKAGTELQWINNEYQKLHEHDKENIERIQSLENEVHNLKNQLESQKHSPSPPPPLPPPPPPPPMPSAQWTWNPIGALMSAIGLSRPIPKKETEAVLPDVRKQAMDDIMQKIERGEFQLRSVRIKPDADSNTTSLSNQGIDEMRKVLISIKKGGSVRNFSPVKEATPQKNFSASLRLNPTRYSNLTDQKLYESKPILSSELEALLSKRRRAIERQQLPPS